jgi:hypothetical protein
MRSTEKENRPIRCSVDSMAKNGYGYLFSLSALIWQVPSCTTRCKCHGHSPSIHGVTLLHPKPVSNGQHRTNTHDAIARHRPRRAKEEQIQREQHSRCKVKPDIDVRSKLEVLGNDEVGVNNVQAPIHDGHEGLERRGYHGEGILCGKEGLVQGEVGEEAEGEGQEGAGQADDGEELEVPAVGVGDEVVPREKEVEAVGKGSDAYYVEGQREGARGRGEPLESMLLSHGAGGDVGPLGVSTQYEGLEGHRQAKL